MIVVLMPSRGRPEAAREALMSFRDTAGDVDTQVIVIADMDDPKIEEYRAIPYFNRPDPSIMLAEYQGNMVTRTNMGFHGYAYGREHITMVGWMADDNRFRTKHWDRHIYSAWEAGHHFVALNDLMWSERPNARYHNLFVDRMVLDALGWYAQPAQAHHYVDISLQCIANALSEGVHYLPADVCEHMHWSIGKGPADAQGFATENGPIYVDEATRFADWVTGQFRDDLLAVKQVVWGP